MSRTLHYPSGTRFGHVRYRAGGCPFLPEAGVDVRYRWMLADRVCTVSPRAHPGGVCADQADGHPLVEVLDRSRRRDGSVRETRHTHAPVGYCSRLNSNVVGYVANRQERTARQHARVGLRELTKALNAGGGALDTDVCDDDGLEVVAPRHRHDALWIIW